MLSAREEVYIMHRFNLKDIMTLDLNPLNFKARHALVHFIDKLILDIYPKDKTSSQICTSGHNCQDILKTMVTN